MESFELTKYLTKWKTETTLLYQCDILNSTFSNLSNMKKIDGDTENYETVCMKHPEICKENSLILIFWLWIKSGRSNSLSSTWARKPTLWWYGSDWLWATWCCPEHLENYEGLAGSTSTSWNLEFELIQRDNFPITYYTMMNDKTDIDAYILMRSNSI